MRSPEIQMTDIQLTTILYQWFINFFILRTPELTHKTTDTHWTKTWSEHEKHKYLFWDWITFYSRFRFNLGPVATLVGEIVEQCHLRSCKVTWSQGRQKSVMSEGVMMSQKRAGSTGGVTGFTYRLRRWWQWMCGLSLCVLSQGVIDFHCFFEA